MVGQNSAGRLEGLDVARFAAFVGMVVVNFKIVMGADAVDTGFLNYLTSAIEGRAAATFVVLAGIGLGLAASRSRYQRTLSVTLKRAAFLIVVGLLNSLIFDADIIHYYAFYFLFGVFLLSLPSKTLTAGIVFINVAFVVMILTLNYDTGWDWSNYSYADFWTPTGFVRNLFFNGWHPVIPWLSFFLFGMLLSRVRLAEREMQNRLIVLGAAGLISAEFVSMFLVGQTGDTEVSLLLTTSLIPPAPLYVLVGMSIASIVVGACLRGTEWLRGAYVLKAVTPAGRQTLTLYIAHILLGMGTLEAAGMLGGQSPRAAIAAAIVFCAISAIYAYLWSKVFKRGPIETLMRKLAG